MHIHVQISTHKNQCRTKEFSAYQCSSDKTYGNMATWYNTLYAYPAIAHWYVMAVACSPPFRGTAHSMHFFSGILSAGLALI